MEDAATAEISGPAVAWIRHPGSGGRRKVTWELVESSCRKSWTGSEGDRRDAFEGRSAGRALTP